MTLERRTGLRRDGEGARRFAAQRSELERGGPLPRQSEKRKAEAPLRYPVRSSVFQRDGHRCRLALFTAGPQGMAFCSGAPLTVHHIRKAGQGGPYTLLNLVTLCAGHNVWLETDAGARWGEPRGLVLRRVPHGGLVAALEDCWARMQAAGIVDWSWQ